MAEKKRNIFGRFRRLHFIGIGGIGMSGIAEILLRRGIEISGSDIKKSDVTDFLEKLGAKIYEGHDAKNVEGADLVVHSSAVKSDNIEMIAAKEQKIPTIKRDIMLGELMRMKIGIGIAGTHGKTTTTSMTGMILIEGGVDPTIVVGGKVKDFGSNARVGEGDHIIVEADEYDHTFLSLTPTIAVITNIEAEHLDIYKEGLSEIREAFIQYANKVPFFGMVICCLDEPNVQDVLPYIERRIMTYGTSSQADLQAVDINYHSKGSTYTVEFNGEKLGEISLQVPGLHNVKNSLASIGVGLELEIPFDTIKKGIEKFGGVQRRFTVKLNKDIMIVDDYGHHPSEVKATIAAARSGWPKRRIISVFQPHLFSRTKDFAADFGRSFLNSDTVFVMNVYPSREKQEDYPGITGETITAFAKKFGHKDVHYVPEKSQLISEIQKEIKSGDIVIFMGAGDITKFADELVEKW